MAEEKILWIYDWTGNPELVTPCSNSEKCLLTDGSLAKKCSLTDNLVCPGKIWGEGCCFQGSTPLVEGMELRPQPWMEGQIEYRGEFISYEEWVEKYRPKDRPADRFCFLEGE